MSHLASNDADIADVGAVLLVDEATAIHAREDGCILRMLGGAGPRTAMQLATAGGLSPAATLRALVRLVERGFVAVSDGAGGVAAYRLNPRGERAAAGDPRRRILLVEDDSTVLELMQMLLEDEGYAVVGARTPAEATALLEAVAFDLVITDGFSTAPTAIVANTMDVLKAAAGTPVALFTAHLIEAEAARAAGFRDLLAKPFDLDILERQVRTLLDAATRPGATPSGRRQPQGYGRTE